MKTVLLASGLALTLMQPVAAQNRDSDGDVVSIQPKLIYFRDSDGDVISVNKYEYQYRDSDGNVISVIRIQRWDYGQLENVYTLEADDGTEFQVAADRNSSGAPVLPDQVSIDGLMYKVVATDDELSLQTASRVNPVAFTLD